MIIILIIIFLLLYKLYSILYGIENYKNNNELIEKTIDKIDNNEVIITFVNKNKLEEFKIFYKYFSKLNLNNLLVISLDVETYNKINKITSTILLEDGKDNLNTINKIFKLGKKDLIYTKVGYKWKKDISKHIRYMNYDIINITSHNIDFEPNLFKIKYNIDTIYFFDNVRNKFYNKKVLDDMTIINNFIKNEKSKVQKDNNKNKIIFFDNYNFNIFMITHGRNNYSI